METERQSQRSSVSRELFSHRMRSLLKSRSLLAHLRSCAGIVMAEDYMRDLVKVKELKRTSADRRHYCIRRVRGAVRAGVQDRDAYLQYAAEKFPEGRGVSLG